MFLLKCLVCGVENPENNKFCSSCGKSLPQTQPLTKNKPSDAGQTLVPASPKGPGLVHVAGGILFLISAIAVGLFVILPMFEEGTSSWEDSSVSAENPGYLTVTTIPQASQPVQVSSRTASGDPILRTWDVGMTGMQMQFEADGTATVRSSGFGYHSTGSWERISEGRYRLRSASGTYSPVLNYDPLAGMMYSEDYSTVFIGTS